MDPGPPPRPSSTQQERSSSHVNNATVPPAPPPPPPPPLPPAKVPKPGFSGAVCKPRPIPPGSSDQPPPLVKDRSMHLPAANTSPPARPFHPCHMFFYGTLMDPDILQAILNLPALPSPPPQPATISGFQVKMWGIYPALVPGTSTTTSSGLVTGTVWKVDVEEHFDRLAAYETAAYEWVEVEATLEDGMVLGGCRAFCWAGRRDSKELEDGGF
ncbi:Nn.00g029120.m01.CDS01 [Neocucurbitaria sp. VM-36]